MRAGERMDAPANGRADGLTGERTDGQADGGADGQTSARADGRTDGRASGDEVRQVRKYVYPQLFRLQQRP